MANINKYNNAKIYRIVSNVTGENYYGSTTEPTLARRLAKHRASYHHFLKGKSKFVTSFKILETNDYDIVLIENFNCNSKSELHARERYYIENNVCVNKYIPNRSKHEYRTDNINKFLEYEKCYRQNNKELLSEKAKQYYESNKDIRLEKGREWYSKNNDRIKKFRQQKEVCGCGGKFTHSHKSEHNKSIKHQAYLKEQSNNQKRISQESFNFIFEMDSLFKLPRTYTNIIITN